MKAVGTLTLLVSMLLLPAAFAQKDVKEKCSVPFDNIDCYPRLLKMPMISVLAGVNYTALGWIKKFRRKAVGEDVPIHWGKFGRAVALGTILGLAFFMAAGFGVMPTPPFETQFDYAVWFSAATGGIIMVDRWLVQGSLGSKAQTRGEV